MKIRKYVLKSFILAFLLSNIALVKAEIANFDTNIKAVKTVTADNQADSLYYLNMAKAYEQENSIDKAIESYKLAIAANPDLEAAYSQLGLIYAEKGDYKNSIKIFKKYLNFSNNPEEEALVKEFIDKLNTLVK
ncbi:MAG: hypothetical protein A2039_06785 [Candidatus Melainabacteria bacterium GWA2_34_9]|nr:MAG: hypothetical protein A2039_06785 [Candidatus Melainabacteria bacterium GWA2_34_9]